MSPQARLRRRFSSGATNSAPTVRQSQASSSATSMGSAVKMPWPISERATRMVTRSSGAITIQQVISGGFPSARAAGPNGMSKPSERAPPTAAALTRKARRSTFGTVPPYPDWRPRDRRHDNANRGKWSDGFRGGGLTEHGGRELRINLGKFRGHHVAHEPQRLGRRRCGLRHRFGAVEVESGVLDDFLDRVAGVHAVEPEAPARLVEAEDAAVGDKPDRPARPIDIIGTRARRADEADARHQGAARMFGAKQDDLRHHVVKMRRAERTWKTHLRMVVLADAHQVDVAFAVDLAARQEEHVDAPLARTIEQLAPTVGEEVVLPALQQRHIGPPAAARATQQRRRRRNG